MRMIGIVGLLVVVVLAAGISPGSATPEWTELTCDQAGTQLPEREQRNPQEFRALVESVLQRAKAGQAEAQCIAGVMYEEGRGVPQDDREAVRWYRLAAEQGHAEAQFSLGIMYESGRGVPKDDREAVRWYRLAAEQGEAYAQYNLGLMYDSGHGVPEDDREAVRWYRLAAAQGHATAQYILGGRYKSGRVVPQDFTLAYAWYTLAAAQGYDLARSERDHLAAMLTPAQLAEGQRLARAWKPGMGELPVPQEAVAPSERVVSTGTAFAIQRDRLLTAAHVVRSCRSIRITQEGRTRSAAVQALDTHNDLALLRVTQPLSSWAVFRGAPPVALGDAVIAAGFPLSGLLATDLHVTTGTVSAMAGLENDTRFWQMTAPVQPGNSGGPLLDRRGAVIGVVVSKLDALVVARQTGDIPQNINFALKAKVAEAFLESQGVALELASAGPPLEIPVIADRAKRWTYLVECVN